MLSRFFINPCFQNHMKHSLSIEEVINRIGIAIPTKDTTTVTIEKAPAYISRLLIESRSKAKVSRHDSGLRINLKEINDDKINFCIPDSSIISIYYKEVRIPKKSPIVNWLFLIAIIIIVSWLNSKSRYSNLLNSLFVGTYMGLMINLFISKIKIFQVIILTQNPEEEEDIFILTSNIKEHIKDFFKYYYPDKFKS